MKVLILSDEVWNDDLHGNNVLSNWFDGSNLELANLYCSPGLPKNNCCKLYFQVTDSMMFFSLLGRKAGEKFNLDDTPKIKESNLVADHEPKIYSFLRAVSKNTEFFRFARELIWSLGSYNTSEIKSFIEDFNPDVIFSTRRGTLKFLRLERVINKLSNKPLIAFTADDEYSTDLISYSPLFWLSRYFYRYMFRKQVHLYSSYCFFSEDQAKYYQEEFNLRTHLLLKGGEFKDYDSSKSVGRPIRLIYAGKLYVGRWQTLSKIRSALSLINTNGLKIVLDIYTKDLVSHKQYTQLHDGLNSYIRGGVSADELQSVYCNADIALHVESFDKVNSALVKYSFSTKIIDCMSSGCAVMAISPPSNAGYKYLKTNDLAFCVEAICEIESELRKIASNPFLISEYKEKVWKIGSKKHDKKSTLNQLLGILKSAF